MHEGRKLQILTYRLQIPDDAKNNDKESPIEEARLNQPGLLCSYDRKIYFLLTVEVSICLSSIINIRFRGCWLEYRAGAPNVHTMTYLWAGWP